MAAAYELIEIYCELIAARLPIIESQKNCPIDLKEAIASVIFASPRCADIPELIDVKKHFTAKYGKEFVTTILELRPNSGVARMLVEKLSAVAPDVQTKVKVLKAIAEEHNINWDSESFEEKESKPAEDLLNGPSAFAKPDERHVDNSKIQVPNVQATYSYDKPVKPSNFSESNSRSMLNTQKYSSMDRGGLNTTTATHGDLRSSGTKGSWEGRTENRHSFGRNDSYSGRENWDIEFKDATSAARAAAESAERASMAARAAAELSSRADITRQYSAESQNSNKHNRSDGNYAASVFPDEQFANAPGNNSFNDWASLGEGKNFNRYVQDDSNRPRPSQSASQSYRKASITDDTFTNSSQKPDGYSEKMSFKETTTAEKDLLSPKTNKNKQYMEAGFRNATGWQDDVYTETFDQFGEERTGRQHGISSSLSRSSTGSENYKVENHNRKSGAVISEDHHVENYQESIHEDVTNMGSYDDYSAAFAEYESNNPSDSVDAAPKYDEESTSYISTLGNNSAAYFPTTMDTWNPRRDSFESQGTLTSKSQFSEENHSSPRFSESLTKSVNPSKSDIMPVMYDMDAPQFDNDDKFYTRGDRNDSMHFSHKQNVFSQDPEPEAHSQTYLSTGEKIVQKASSNRQHTQKASPKSSFRPPVATYFDHDEEDVAKETSLNRAHLVSGASSKTNNERKTNSSKYSAATSTKPKFQANRGSSHAGSKEQPGATKQTTSKTMPVSKTSEQDQNYYSSAVGKPSNPFRETQSKTNIAKAPTVKADPPTREDSTKRASHVHPKLPDYDSIAAQMQSLRTDRR